MINSKVKLRLRKLTTQKNDDFFIYKDKDYIPKITEINNLAVWKEMTPNKFIQNLTEQEFKIIANLEKNNQKCFDTKRICCLAPILPHPCELEIWNITAKKMNTIITIITSKVEINSFNETINLLKISGNSIHLDCLVLDSISENKTFLSGLDEVLQDYKIVISLGESSVASYQAHKARKSLQNRLVIWQNSPRPPEALLGSRFISGNPIPELSREKTIRKEVLKSCDAIISFDKDGSTWAYLENVNAQRIRRIPRGINLSRFSQQINSVQRLNLRQELSLPETDFIFLQAGPLEIEAGALDSIYAFKSLLQSHPSYLNNTKLVFCGSGNAAVDIRQAVVDLKLDEHVFFINPNNSDTKILLGNQLLNLLAISDAIIHNPITITNGNSHKNLDCSYDILCSIAAGVSIISNGNGWIGEWLGRFYKTFATGNIHAQSKMMRECIEKQDKLESIKEQSRKALEKEMSIDKTTDELQNIINSLLVSQNDLQTNDIKYIITNIESTVKAKKYLDAITLISQAFEHENLTNAIKSILFRHIADCFTKLGDLENGRNNYIKALELDPYNAKVLIGLGTIALQKNDYNSAVPHFQRGVTLAPNDDMATLGLGLSFEGLGELTQAYKWTLRSCYLNIENTASIYNLVKLSYNMEIYEDAEKILTKYIEYHPNDVNMIFTLGGIAYKLNKFILAEDFMVKILTLDPNNNRALSLLSQIKNKSNQQLRA